MAAQAIAAQAMRDAGFDDAKTAAIRGILAAAVDVAGHEAASKLTAQRHGIEALLLQMGQQQTEIANNMRAMQAEKETIKGIMEQFQQEGTAMKDTMNNQSLGLQQMETCMQALKAANEGIAGIHCEAHGGQLQRAPSTRSGRAIAASRGR